MVVISAKTELLPPDSQSVIESEPRWRGTYWWKSDIPSLLALNTVMSTLATLGEPLLIVLCVFISLSDRRQAISGPGISPWRGFIYSVVKRGKWNRSQFTHCIHTKASIETPDVNNGIR